MLNGIMCEQKVCVVFMHALNRRYRDPRFRQWLSMPSPSPLHIFIYKTKTFVLHLVTDHEMGDIV